jgi:hypothetical protein
MAKVTSATHITSQYTLSDFERIIHNGFEYNVHPEVIALVSKIADQVGAPTYVKTPTFPKNKSVIGTLTSLSSGNALGSSIGGVGGGFHGSSWSTDSSKRTSSNNSTRRSDNQQITDEDWESIRAFQATELARSQGIESNISVIRSSLNRITSDNYVEMRDAILSEIARLIANNADDESLLKIGNSIFNTASSNQFYSHTYAMLYKDLIESHDFFKPIFETSMKDYMKLFQTIDYVDPKKDYDKFCEINKANDKRKAMSLFIVNLMKEGIVSTNEVIEIVLNLQRTLNENLKVAGKTNELDEISENIYIIVKNGHTMLSSTDEWINILNNITFVSLLKVKSYPSITNKTIFKHVDILELFQ